MHDRVKPLEGIVNFRDFGGYPTQCGARVQRNRLFRSANFAEAKPSDFAFLDSLNVNLVVDLRRPDERANQPSLWPLSLHPDKPPASPIDKASTVKVIQDSGTHHQIAPWLQFAREGDLSPDGVHAHMMETYALLPYEDRHIDLFRSWFSGLQRIDGAAIVHCAAGKDRTGLVCALTLHVLGCDYKTIMDDYLLTNAAVDSQKRLTHFQGFMRKKFGREIGPESVALFAGVHDNYLTQSWRVIENRSGSISNYLHNELGVTDAEVSALQTKYLQQV